MSLTPLHLALGVTQGDLSIELVEQACARGVKERENLDWKSTLPLTLPAENNQGRNEQQDELAKDIAAMANGRGGLIVYGVAEKSSAASHVQSVGEPDDTTIQNIRRVATNLIYPPVTGLTFNWLSADDSDDTVLTLGIGQSPEAPHLIRPKKQPAGTGYWFAVPYRNGPDTDWMPERMIESAYRDRLANRRQREHDLREMHADLVASTAAQDGGSWVVAIARPESPLPTYPRLLNPFKAVGIFTRAWNSPWRHHLQNAVSAEYVLRDVQPKRGLRRFRQKGSHLTKAMGSSEGRIKAIAELHYDGSVGVALARGGALDPTEFADDRFLAAADLDQAALNLFALARQAARDLGVTGDYEVLLSVESGRGVLFRHHNDDGTAGLKPWSEDDRVPPFRPVDGIFMFSGDLEAALSSLEELAEDAVNQTGAISRLSARELKLVVDLDD